MTRIAFFTLNAYEMLTGGYDSDAVGGAQLQQILIGRELADRGYDIAFVEYDTDRKSEGTIDGIEIVTKPRPSGSELSRGLEALSGTARVLRRLDPDVCYRRVLNFELLLLSLYTTMTETRFVYGIAHDDELTDSPHLFSEGIKNTNLYNRLNRRALSRADAVIAQNDRQHSLAIRRLDTEIHKIPNCYEIRDVEPVEWDHESPVVFWAARFQPWKRPEVVADLAEALPDVTFVMAGTPSDEQVYAEIEERAESIENLRLLGHVPFDEIDRYFLQADVFLNTSSKEGFPNTFVQSWAYGTPVASLNVDPNDILSEEGIGIVTNGDISKLRAKLEKLTGDSERLTRLGQESKAHFRSDHTVDVIADRYEQVFLHES